MYEDSYPPISENEEYELYEGEFYRPDSGFYYYDGSEVTL
jgi:hypothetical protein